jgi:hypothetical protein
VVRRDENSFRLATLDGHLEAGEIEFSAKRDGDALHFEIESWARAGDRLSALLYNNLRLAKEIQLNMWSHFCVRAAALAGGRPQGGITIRTRWVPWPDDRAPRRRFEPQHRELGPPTVGRTARGRPTQARAVCGGRTRGFALPMGNVPGSSTQNVQIRVDRFLDQHQAIRRAERRFTRALRCPPVSGPACSNCYCPWKKSLIAVAAASLAVSGASPQAVSIVRNRL